MIFTDGSSNVKDRSGGWAWVAIDAYDGECFDMGGDRDTTNNRMEMVAWIKGLHALHEAFGPSTVVVSSDSQYVGYGAMNRARKRNLNVDLWLELDEEIDKHLYVEFRHVKGHRDDHYNNLADRLAGEARHAFNYVTNCKACEDGGSNHADYCEFRTGRMS
jgi:ribonuclease HI